MKIVILTFTMLVANVAMAQSFNCEGGKLRAQQVVEVDGKSAAEIYKAANRWIAKNLRSNDKLIQSQIENEMITGNGFEAKGMKLTWVNVYDMTYSFTVDVKDGKMRLSLDNFNMVGNNYKVETYCCKDDGSVRTNSQSKNIQESVGEFMRKITTEFKKSINEKGDDW